MRTAPKSLGLTQEYVREQAALDDKAAQDALGDRPKAFRDSFQNFAAGMGIGTDNITSAATYGYNPITRQRVLCDFMYRGSWLAGVAVDVVAEDMTRAGVDYVGTVPPDDQEKMSSEATTLNIWGSLCDVVKWGRLYGGAIGVLMIDGQDTSKPLNIDKIGKGQFRGILVLDRWMISPSIEDLVGSKPNELGPDMGMPRFYTISATGALPPWKVHYSRVIRMVGVDLPYWQRIYEQLWGQSVFERLYDRMVAFDGATQGASQLVYKCYGRTLKLDGFRDAVGTEVEKGIIASQEFRRRYQSIEGIDIIDAKDELTVQGHSAFSGLAEILMQFAQQLSGALEIPLVRLFGQQVAGMSTGDNDLHTYYDGIVHKQNRTLQVPVKKVYVCIARSLGIKLPDNFNVSFKSLWQMTEPEKSDVANKDANTILGAFESQLISAAVALLELRQLGRLTGRFTNISDEDVEEARNNPPEVGEATEPPAPPKENVEGQQQAAPGDEPGPVPDGGQEHRAADAVPFVQRLAAMRRAARVARGA